MKAVGYVRVSTDDQAESGLGLDAQRSDIIHHAERKQWDLLRVEQDAASGSSLQKRPGLKRALKALSSGEAQVLIVSKLDRLSRSLIDFSELLAQSEREGWSLVALDLNVDTTTATGRMLANIVMAIAQWERERIGERTKAALGEAKKAGVHVGRPKLEVGDEVQDIVWQLRTGGLGWRDVAKRLDGLAPRSDGKPWTTTTAWRIYKERPCPICKLAGDPRPLRITYPPTKEQLERLVRSQQGKCAICSGEFWERWGDYRNVTGGTSFWERGGPIADHDHFTGRVRGALCSSCNLRLTKGGDTAIGFLARVSFDDDPFVHAALHYTMGLPPVEIEPSSGSLREELSDEQQEELAEAIQGRPR